jgi:hypothetical protein
MRPGSGVVFGQRPATWKTLPPKTTPDPFPKTRHEFICRSLASQFRHRPRFGRQGHRQTLGLKKRHRGGIGRETRGPIPPLSPHSLPPTNSGFKRSDVGNDLGGRVRAKGVTHARCDVASGQRTRSGPLTLAHSPKRLTGTGDLEWIAFLPPVFWGRGDVRCNSSCLPPKKIDGHR